MTVKLNQKQSRLTYLKAIDADKRTITAYVSTYEWDRTDERIAKGAWKLEKFKQNPVVMWGHDYSQPPIAKAISIEEDEKGLISVMQFADTEKANEIFELYKTGFLSAFSVGFNPKKYQMEPIEAERKGIVFTDVELLEYSAVSIPANPGALITNDVAALVCKTIGESALMKIKVEGQEPQYMVAPTEGPEEPQPEPQPQPQPAAQAKDLGSSLKYVIDLARSSKSKKVEGKDLELLNNAVTVFQDIINENRDGVPVEVVEKLARVVDEYAKVVANLYPDASLTVRRAMNQIEKALREQRTAA